MQKTFSGGDVYCISKPTIVLVELFIHKPAREMPIGTALLYTH